MPVSAAVSNSASVWCTVPMSRMAVVPPSSSSAMPSRADARSESGSWAASSGQMRSRSQASSGLSSARPAEQRLAQVQVRLHQAGHD